MTLLNPSPSFYKRFVVDIINGRKIGNEDNFLKLLNAYHPKVNFTVEINPNKFLDTNIHVNSHGKVSTTVHRKPFKKPIHWSSRVPKRYKRNSITGELYRAKRISDDVEEMVKKIKDKFCKANYPKRFVESVINEFKKKDPMKKKVNLHSYHHPSSKKRNNSC